MTNEQLLSDYFMVNANYKVIEKKRQELSDMIKAKLMADNSMAMTSANFIGTLKAVSRSGIDTDKLKKTYPEIYQDVSKITEYTTLQVVEK